MRRGLRQGQPGAASPAQRGIQLNDWLAIANFRLTRAQNKTGIEGEPSIPVSKPIRPLWSSHAGQIRQREQERARRREPEPERREPQGPEQREPQPREHSKKERHSWEPSRR